MGKVFELTDENIDRVAAEAKQKKHREKVLSRLAFERNGMVIDGRDDNCSEDVESVKGILTDGN
jgi:hypothetical protein